MYFIFDSLISLLKVSYNITDSWIQKINKDRIIVYECSCKPPIKSNRCCLERRRWFQITDTINAVNLWMRVFNRKAELPSMGENTSHVSNVDKTSYRHLEIESWMMFFLSKYANSFWRIPFALFWYHGLKMNTKFTTIYYSTKI